MRILLQPSVMLLLACFSFLSAVYLKPATTAIASFAIEHASAAITPGQLEENSDPVRTRKPDGRLQR